MSGSRIRSYPTIILTLIVLLAIAAIGPAAGLATTDHNRSASDRTGLLGNGQPSLTTPTNEVLNGVTAEFVTPSSQTPSVASLVSDRITSPSDRVVTSDWAPHVGFLFLGYTRHTDGETLDHDARNRIFDYVRSAPGAHIASIADGTDIPRSTVRYHLRVLEDADLLTGAMIRGRHRYAPPEVDLELAAALHDEPTRAVLETVARFEPVSVSGIAEEIDRSPSTVAHHLDKLESAGLLTREQADGRVNIYLDGVDLEMANDRLGLISKSGAPSRSVVE